MATRIFSSLLFGILLSSFVGAAQSIKPELIRTEAGATLIFNTVDSFFAVDIAGDNIKPAPNTDGFFQVDARLVRVTNTPQRELAPAVGQRVLMPKELLQMQYRRDLDEEQFSLQRPIQNSKQEFITTAKGRLLMHWWFDMPGSGSGESQRHYISTICERQVLTICTPLLPGDAQEPLRQYLIESMQSVRESDDPINVREYAKELQGDQ